VPVKRAGEPPHSDGADMNNARTLRTTLLLLILPLTLAAQEWTPLGVWEVDADFLCEDRSTGVIYVYGGNMNVENGMRLHRLAPDDDVWNAVPLPTTISGIDRDVKPEGSHAIASGPLPDLFAFDGVLFVDRGREGLYRTTNDGATWEKTALGGGTIVKVGDELYGTGADAALYRSRDTGRTWQAADDIVSPVATGIRLFSDGRHLFRLGQAKGYHRNDSANVWTRVTPPSDWHGSFAVTGDTLFFFIGDSRLIRSFDGGATWPADTFDLGYDTELNDGLLWWTEKNRLYTMAVDGSGKRVVDTLDHQPSDADFLFSRERILMADHTGVWRWDTAAERMVPFNDGRSETPVSHVVPSGDDARTGRYLDLD
jgi:hypothetical protein